MIFKNKYAQSFAIAAYVGTVSALGTYFTALTQGLDWRQMLSIVGTSFIMPFAALSRALPDPLHQSPALTVERAETVTQNIPPPAETDAEAAARAFAPHRNPHGQFARKVPPDLSISDH